ncbi:RHS repeat-associated core domain containing protein [Nitzschia inconspicua]|uniref:RHS repeat-associated core domain containing protein n=1 Tax=Nitzschia inconspicua TaxID=303405 RepID=A0A9K3KLB3_9STRA|nr:RHS repeat-associated core domain containing protein [Nitzschia inconspicua]
MNADAENPRGSQVSQAPPINSVKYSRPAPDTMDPQTASNRFAVIVLGISVVICLGVAAIVLPFTLDSYCNCPSVPNLSGSPSPTASPGSSPSSTVPPGTPTATPTRLDDVSDQFVQFVNNYARRISGDEPFEDPSSPQFRAAQFIADESTFGSTISSLGQLDDLYAVTVLYYSTKGDGWTECSKEGTNCDGEPWLSPDVSNCEWNWITCNDDGRVVDVVFTNADGNNLDGPLTLEMGLLTGLTQFVAVNNKISGSFPEEFGKLTNVTRLILPSNSMNGTIPNDFLADSPLQIIILSDNGFSGNIPQSFSEVTTLTQVHLANNSFSGTIPEAFGSLPNLGILDLTENRLIGIIPDAIYSDTLERLYLGGNQQLTGSISSAVGDATSLLRLRIPHTMIEGIIPEELFTLPRLEEIHLANNNLSGTLSSSVANLGDTLRILKLDGNELSGSLPSDAINQLTISNILTFEQNSFTGSISSETCGRIGNGRDRLQELTVDCNEVSCSCCTNCP